MWKIINDVFNNYKPDLHLPSRAKAEMSNFCLSREKLLALITLHEEKNMYSHLFTQNAVVVVKLESSLWKKCEGSLLESWELFD